MAGQDRIDAIFEFQTWMEEMIIQAQKRVSENNGFTFDGTNMMNEAGHIANMTNQLRAILFDIRTEVLGYQQSHGVTGTHAINKLKLAAFAPGILLTFKGRHGEFEPGKAQYSISNF